MPPSKRPRGRPSTIAPGVILAIRAALKTGQPVAAIAKRWRVSRRYVRNLGCDETWRRRDARPLPPEILALESITEENGADAEQAAMARELRALADLLPWR